MLYEVITHPDPSAMRLDDVAHDAHAEAETAGGGIGGIRPVELVEHPGHLSRIHADAAVGHGKLVAPAVGRTGDPDGAARRRVLERIAQQVP